MAYPSSQYSKISDNNFLTKLFLLLANDLVQIKSLKQYKFFSYY